MANVSEFVLHRIQIKTINNYYITIFFFFFFFWGGGGAGGLRGGLSKVFLLRIQILNRKKLFSLGTGGGGGGGGGAEEDYSK